MILKLGQTNCLMLIVWQGYSKIRPLCKFQRKAPIDADTFIIRRRNMDHLEPTDWLSKCTSVFHVDCIIYTGKGFARMSRMNSLWGPDSGTKTVGAVCYASTRTANFIRKKIAQAREKIEICWLSYTTQGIRFITESEKMRNQFRAWI